MELVFDMVDQVRIAEIADERFVIRSEQDATELVGNAAFQGVVHLLLYERQVDPAFFDLRSGLAGVVAQKLTNYRVGASIIGDFDGITSSAFRAFVRESNQRGPISFVADRATALARLRR